MAENVEYASIDHSQDREDPGEESEEDWRRRNEKTARDKPEEEPYSNHWLGKLKIRSFDSKENKPPLQRILAS